MDLKQIRVLLAVVWMLASGIAGVSAQVNSLPGWAVMAAFALLPPLIMARYWTGPELSMSQRMQDVIR